VLRVPGEELAQAGGGAEQPDQPRPGIRVGEQRAGGGAQPGQQRQGLIRIGRAGERRQDACVEPVEHLPRPGQLGEAEACEFRPRRLLARHGAGPLGLGWMS
jgi:hypothetical protein